ncbi:30S ribosomal protein S18 [Candidatus Giovannonibacteria bacterium]|nr:30S ribosomal protein S18 [Candidatus Giovannonibacteria bacterium]
MADKQCYFCTSNIKNIDYKDNESLKKFTDPQARIMPRKRTGICALHQRKLSRSIKRARVLGLMPFLTE